MDSICWEYCQTNSDRLLSSGLAALKSTACIKAEDIIDTGPGVYMMSLHGEALYIGEAKNLRSRLSQQFRPKTSTFYKNYIQAHGGESPVPISTFDLQILSTQIGRKELEEFGIVNLPAPLNRFHRDKRDRVDISGASRTEWDKVQVVYSQVLNEGESIVHDLTRSLWADATPKPKPGLYLVFDSKNEIVYIGESTDVRVRYTTHSGRTYFSALRKNIGRSVFGFEYIPGKKKQFLPEQDAQVSAFLNGCQMSYLKVDFGRLELEENLIQRHQPPLNRKSR